MKKIIKAALAYIGAGIAVGCLLAIYMDYKADQTFFDKHECKPVKNVTLGAPHTADRVAPSDPSLLQTEWDCKDGVFYNKR